MEIFRQMSLKPEVTPVPSSEFPTPARRPAYSVLDNTKYRGLGLEDLKPWQEALGEYIAGRASNGRE
jgi:dTDP-4-dehydrorhamnose reductase